MTMAVASCAALLSVAGEAAVVVDVAARTVSVREVQEPFVLADFARWRLLEGLDDIALTLRYEDAISAYEVTRPAWLPVITAG